MFSSWVLLWSLYVVSSCDAINDVLCDISQSLLTLPVAMVSDHISVMCFDVKVNPKMPRTKSKAVPEGNGSFPPNKAGSGELTMAKPDRLLKNKFDGQPRRIKESHVGTEGEPQKTKRSGSHPSR